MEQIIRSQLSTRSMADKYVCALDEGAKKYAREYLNETDDNRQESIDEIRKWLAENRDINASNEDATILAFLRGCKFNMEKAKVKIRNYYVMRTEIPQWFQHHDPDLPEIRELLKLGVFVPLRKFHENRLVVVIRTAAHNPRKHKQDDVFKAGMMLCDVAAKQCENAQIYGVTAVFDMKNISLSHARQLTPGIIKKAVHAWQNYHCRPQQLEFINAPLYINVVLNVFKSFMTEKLKNRVRVHFGALDSLHKVVNKEVLPIEYGGDDGELKQHIDYWENKLDEAKGWLAHNEQFRADLPSKK